MSSAILLVGDSESNQNLYFKTHFLAGDPFVYLQTESGSVLIVNSMELGRAKNESIVNEVKSFDDYDFRALMREMNDRTRAFGTLIGRAVRQAGADRIITEPNFPLIYADFLRSDGIRLEVDPKLFVRERRQKTPEQIAAIEEAQRATERSIQRALDALSECEDHDGILYRDGKPFTSELLGFEIDLSLMRDGMDISLSPIAAGGPRAADPHFLGEGPLRSGEAIILDVFPRTKRARYFADMTRTVVRGRPDQRLMDMYDAVSRSLDAALSQVRAGANGRDVHRAVEAVFEEAGYSGEGSGPRFTHSTGHGLGLAVHEAPYLGAMDMELLENDVVTIEPGLYDPSLGGVRIEDLVVVTKDGCRNLTNFPRQFQI